IDVVVEVTQCRNISVDVRYILFIVDKLAGATNLIEELTLVE
ncbi:MAG: S46 family peptidase, partial [Bacteroidota bacterium]